MDIPKKKGRPPLPENQRKKVIKKKKTQYTHEPIVINQQGEKLNYEDNPKEYMRKRKQIQNRISAEKSRNMKSLTFK